MDELQKYVDMLFQHQPQTTEITELKEEIYSNMVAKQKDLLEQGMDEVSATNKAKESLDSVEELIEGNQFTDIDHYHMECLQSVLLNCTIFWIFSLPLMLIGHSAFSFLGLILTVIFGITYIVKSRNLSDVVAFVSVSASRKRRKYVWIVWTIFFLVYEAIIAALTFGSNLWFGRPLDISGPYQFADIAIRFYAPLLTIVIPITVGEFTKLLIKNEKRYKYEGKK